MLAQPHLESPPRPGSTRRLRVAARAMHLSVAVLLVALSITAPVIGTGLARVITLAAVLPLLGLTGLTMWRPSLLPRRHPARTN